jgi:hypothetical protein
MKESDINVLWGAEEIYVFADGSALYEKHRDDWLTYELGAQEEAQRNT